MKRLSFPVLSLCVLGRKAVYGIAVALLLTVATAFSMVVPAKAQPTFVEVINPTVGNGNFIFYTSTTKVGDRFNATIWTTDAVNLFAFQICLTVNDTLLNITGAWLPAWDPQYVFFGLSSIEIRPILFDNDGDGSREAVILGDALVVPPGVTFTGRRLAAIVEFEILYEPTVQEPIVWDYLDISNLDTYLHDDLGFEIPAIIVSGYYEFNYAPVIHDVAITGFMVFVDGHLLPSMTVNANVTVENQGTSIESFNVTLYAGNLTIGKQEVAGLEPGLNVTLTFEWDVFPARIMIFPPPWDPNVVMNETLPLEAKADVVSGEIDVADNVYSDGLISIIWMVPDVNGDGKIDMRDLGEMARAFGSHEGDPRWNPMVDFNSDGIVDMRDLGFSARSFGEVY